MDIPESSAWTCVSCTVEHTGTAALTFAYHGKGAVDILEFTLLLN